MASSRYAAFAALCLVGLAAIQVTRTQAGVLPEDAPGYLNLSVAAPHRGAEIRAHYWYPAAGDTSVALVGQNALFYGFAARSGALGDGRTHPVVLLSHGSGGNAVRLGWLAARLAAAGFIVAAPDHPGTTSGDSLPAQTVEPWNRTADLTLLLDVLLKSPPAGIRPDPERVAVVGFSLGGGTAMLSSGARLSRARFIDYCNQNADADDCRWLLAGGVDFLAIDQTSYEADLSDPRIRAAGAVDPALSQAMTPESLGVLTMPVMVINLGADGAIPEAMLAAKMAAHLPSASYQTVPGVAHFSFLARCSLFGAFVIGLAGDDNICSDRGLGDRAKVQDEAGGMITAFLTKALGGQ